MNYKCHYDVALVIFADEYISTSFKYDEDKSKWFYKDIEDIWNEDKELKKLKYEITTRGFDKFIKKYEKVNEKKDEISFYNSIFYLETALNLKKDSYIKKIIKELKQFY
jgi:tRNA nucleotidyltransferase/poly(A) polymerase